MKDRIPNLLIVVVLLSLVGAGGGNAGPAAPAVKFPVQQPISGAGSFAITNTLDDKIKPPYSFALDFSIQRELPHNFMVQAAYTLSRLESGTESKRTVDAVGSVVENIFTSLEKRQQEGVTVVKELEMIRKVSA